MLQLTNHLRTGELKVLEVPPPILRKGMVRIRNHYSVISPGTEADTLKVSKKGLLAKAMERPAQVKQVFETFKKEGALSTYHQVMKKLESRTPMGYSCAGEVIDVAEGVTGFAPGDRVACGGVGYANHAEIVVVPKNLCVKLPPDTDLKKAAYNTLGAIAMQGVRQSNLKIGESCAVVGLGLIGQITCAILKAGGIRVFGIDLDERIMHFARDHYADAVSLASDSGLVEKILNWSTNNGVDSVIITASSDDTTPINLAGCITRGKGSVVVLGNIPTGFERENYYKKELELKMSCSYGPGRYDPEYEEGGIDYPLQHVRWTENRNMQAFQELLYRGQIDMAPLTTHSFPLENAEEAYRVLLSREDLSLGILIEYDCQKDLERKPVILRQGQKKGELGLGFIGSGNYASGYLLPHLAKEQGIAFKGIFTASGLNSRVVGEKYSFDFCASDETDIFKNENIDTVFIVTRHDTHKDYMLKALRAGKHVFVEKPLCLTEDEEKEIEEVYLNEIGAEERPHLLVGFNRRFSPLTREIKERLNDEPVSMLYRVNAGKVSKESWVANGAVGGGRIIGEVCHFIDWMTYVCGSSPKDVYASALQNTPGEETYQINLRFANGSTGTILYLANGARVVSKEYIETYQGEKTFIIKDFKELEFCEKNKRSKKRLPAQNKGQKEMLAAFLSAIKNNAGATIPVGDIFTTTKTTFKIIQSAEAGQALTIG